VFQNYYLHEYNYWSRNGEESDLQPLQADYFQQCWGFVDEKGRFNCTMGMNPDIEIVRQ